MSNMNKKQLAQRAMERAATAAKNASGLAKYHAVSSRAAEDGWLRQRDLIPRDTRSLTARMFGDPLPERSALYRRQHSDRET